MILNDKQIKKIVKEEEMINPFVDKLVHKGISHGLGTPSSVLEGGWRGNLVMEFSNHTNLPIRLYANSGAGQILFFEGEEPETSYAEGSRKYQDQRGITLAKSK